jgi:hypothetical protein
MVCEAYQHDWHSNVINSLTAVGEAMVVGDSVLLPSRIKIEPPKEKPLSATIDFWSRWQEDITNPDFSIAVENMRRQSRARNQS